MHAGPAAGQGPPVAWCWLGLLLRVPSLLCCRMRTCIHTCVHAHVRTWPLLLRVPSLLCCRMRQRTFVLAPLCDLSPGFRHPLFDGTLEEEYRALRSSEAAAAAASGGHPPRWPVRVLPMREDVTWELGARTYIMGVINVTPDSFSDGGRHASPTAALHAAQRMMEAGADVLDLGAESTRPGADRISEEEELARLIPAIRAIRGSGIGGLERVLISADTSRASVAASAIAAGADVINDISGGLFDEAMLRTVAQLYVPLVLMHTRGLPSEMMGRAEYTQMHAEVCSELSARFTAAQACGMPPWLLIADPGIGFAKSHGHNLAMLAELPRFVRHFASSDGSLAGATLVGASRKGFIGSVLSQPDPLKRQWGTAATVAAAVVGDVDIVRVHEVGEMAQVARMADAIYRPRPPRAGEGVRAEQAAQSEQPAPDAPPPSGVNAIELEQICFDCIVGIREREQKALQPLQVDLTMHLAHGVDACAHTGDLNGSVRTLRGVACAHGIAQYDTAYHALTTWGDSAGAGACARGVAYAHGQGHAHHGHTRHRVFARLQPNRCPPLTCISPPHPGASSHPPVHPLSPPGMSPPCMLTSPCILSARAPPPPPPCRSTTLRWPSMSSSWVSTANGVCLSRTPRHSVV